MPISTVPSASVRTHSWDLVYLRSAGTLLMNRVLRVSRRRLSDQGLAKTHERRLHHSRIQQLAADIHLHPRGRGCGHARQRNRALERRGEAAAGDLALAYAGYQDLLVVAQHAAILQQQTD